MQAPRRWSGRFLWQNVENLLHKREGDYHNITQNIVIKIFLNTKYGIYGFFVKKLCISWIFCCNYVNCTV